MFVIQVGTTVSVSLTSLAYLAGQLPVKLLLSDYISGQVRKEIDVVLDLDPTDEMCARPPYDSCAFCELFAFATPMTPTLIKQGETATFKISIVGCSQGRIRTIVQASDLGTVSDNGVPATFDPPYITVTGVGSPGTVQGLSFVASAQIDPIPENANHGDIGAGGNLFVQIGD